MEAQKPFKAQKHTIAAVGAGGKASSCSSSSSWCLARSVSVSDSCELTVGVIQ